MKPLRQTRRAASHSNVLFSVRKQIAAMINALDGVDLRVFTGGIGENDSEVRAAICSGLSWIGVSLDEARNLSASNPINNSESRCSVRVVASQEDEQIARHSRKLISHGIACSDSDLEKIGDPQKAKRQPSLPEEPRCE